MMTEEEKDLYRSWEEESLLEVLNDDPVSRNIRYVSFLSRSKGRDRRGRKILREKTVQLVTYCGKTYSWEKFPFDEIVSEVLKNQMGEGYGEILKDRILQMEEIKKRRSCLK